MCKPQHSPLCGTPGCFSTSVHRNLTPTKPRCVCLPLDMSPKWSQSRLSNMQHRLSTDSGTVWSCLDVFNFYTFSGQSKLLRVFHFQNTSPTSFRIQDHAKIFFNPYTTADRFCLFSFAAAASKQVRLDKRSRYKCVLDLPLPHLIDARPWRCLDCGVTFSVVPADVRASFPQVLHHKIVKQKALWFSGRFLVHTAQKFAEMFNAAAVKRFMLDMYIANSFSLAYEEKRLALLACIPSLRALRGVLRKALASFLPNLVMEIQKSAHVYSGSAIKGDGNYKVPPRIRGQGCRSPNLCVYLNIHIYIYMCTCIQGHPRILKSKQISSIPIHAPYGLLRRISSEDSGYLRLVRDRRMPLKALQAAACRKLALSEGRFGGVGGSTETGHCLFFSNRIVFLSPTKRTYHVFLSPKSCYTEIE